MKQVGTVIKQRLQAMNVDVSDTSSDQTGESEIVQQLKDVFHASAKKSLKTQMLPNSWTKQKIMEEFGATDYMVKRAKALAKEKGILANPKLSGRIQTQRAVEQVKEWYRSDEVSRVMPVGINR